MYYLWEPIRGRDHESVTDILGWRKIRKFLKSTSEGSVSHYLGPKDSKMANLSFLSRCFALPTGPQSLCSNYTKREGQCPRKPTKVTYIFGIVQFNQFKIIVYILNYLRNEKNLK